MTELAAQPFNYMPSSLPLNRIEDEHVPAVSSPLNPNATASYTRTREQREKKATLKKRELTDGEIQGTAKKPRKPTKDPNYLAPIKYVANLPRLTDFDPPKLPNLVPVVQRGKQLFYDCPERAQNKKTFRYTVSIADPAFTSINYARNSDTEPYGPRLDLSDAGSNILFNEEITGVTTEKGFRMARANVFVREGRYFWECRIVSGVKRESDEPEDGGHVRVGWARREASLEGPVGYDPYSYGLRDVAGEKVHMSRPKAFASSAFCEGDVIGLEITLPSLALHKKVVDGVYNKAVDVSDDLDPSASNDFMDIIRDRAPFQSKTAQLYFETADYAMPKIMDDYMNPAPITVKTDATASVDPPNPNHPEPSLRTLPFSEIKVYKNGQLVGTPYADLLAFLPPASKPQIQSAGREVDDGSLGYYPAISVFRGGAVETNLGPNFWFPPPDLENNVDTEMANVTNTNVNPTTNKHIAGRQSALRPISERFSEQIAEDVTIDILDEVHFWDQEGRGALRGNGESELGLAAPHVRIISGDVEGSVEPIDE